MTMIEVPLHAIAHGRAGDKGNRSNISLIVYREETWKHLQDQVTEARVLEVFRHKGASKVARFDLPTLGAFNFVIDDALEGGVNGSLGIDGHGKTLSFLLLGEVSVRVPESCLPDNSPYAKT